MPKQIDATFGVVTRSSNIGCFHADMSPLAIGRRLCDSFHVVPGGTDPGSSMGTGNPTNEGELVTCFVAFETDNFDPTPASYSWESGDTTPPVVSLTFPADGAARGEARPQAGELIDADLGHEPAR